MVRERGSAPWHARLLSETIHVRLRQEKVNIVAPAHHGDGHHANRWGNKQRGKQSTNGPCYVCVRGGGADVQPKGKNGSVLHVCPALSPARTDNTYSEAPTPLRLGFRLDPSSPSPPAPSSSCSRNRYPASRQSALLGSCGSTTCMYTHMDGRGRKRGRWGTHPHHATPPCESTMRDHHASISRSA